MRDGIKPGVVSHRKDHDLGRRIEEGHLIKHSSRAKSDRRQRPKKTASREKERIRISLCPDRHRVDRERERGSGFSLKWESERRKTTREDQEEKRRRTQLGLVSRRESSRPRSLMNDLNFSKWRSICSPYPAAKSSAYGSSSRSQSSVLILCLRVVVVW